MARILTAILIVGLLIGSAYAGVDTYKQGKLKPTDSQLKVKVGDMAPDFELPSVTGEKVRLSDYRGKKNVMISFVPAAWTPVCSDQWPGYNIALEMFDQYDATLMGITVDNTPSQWAWSKAMNNIKFPILSDFWPHGKVSDMYGVLRGDGMSERALFLVDKKGVIRFIHVSDINVRPKLGMIMREVEKLK